MFQKSVVLAAFLTWVCASFVEAGDGLAGWGGDEGVSLVVSLQSDPNGNAVSAVAVGEPLRLTATVSGLDEGDGEMVAVTIYDNSTSVGALTTNGTQHVKNDHPSSSVGTRVFKAKAVFSHTNRQGLTEWSADVNVAVVGVEEIIVENNAPPYVCPGGSITLRAVPDPSGASFPSGWSTWTVLDKPQDSNVGNPSPGATAAITPDKPGTYIFKATCGTSNTAEFSVHAVEITFYQNGIEVDEIDIYPGVAENVEVRTNPSPVPLSLIAIPVLTIEVDPATGPIGNSPKTINVALTTSSTGDATIRCRVTDTYEPNGPVGELAVKRVANNLDIWLEP